MNALAKSSDSIVRLAMPIPSTQSIVTVVREQQSSTGIVVRFPKTASQSSTPIAYPGNTWHRQAAWLSDALDELAGTPVEADEEGFAAPTAAMIATAERILQSVACLNGVPEPAIYPTEDGELAIMFRRQDIESALLIILEQSGSAACFSAIVGGAKRVRYDSADQIPDELVEAGLRKLAR